MEEKKEGFGSKIGFILAAAGSAVGLGNIWRFPYLAAKYGGGFFLLVYIILVTTFGFSLMVTEISLGRKTGKSVIGAYKDADKRFAFLGDCEYAKLKNKNLRVPPCFWAPLFQTEERRKSYERLHRKHVYCRRTERNPGAVLLCRPGY